MIRVPRTTKTADALAPEMGSNSRVPMEATPSPRAEALDIEPDLGVAHTSIWPAFARKGGLARPDSLRAGSRFQELLRSVGFRDQ